jgi:Family of unknown function (DUF5906)
MSYDSNTAPAVEGANTSDADTAAAKERRTGGAAKPAKAKQKDYHQFLLDDFAEHIGQPVGDILNDTAMQFFYDDDFFEEWAKRKEQARELIEDYLLPLNRQHALINVAGSFGVADFRSLTQPVSHNPEIERAWIPRSLPDMHTLADFGVRYADRSCTVIRKGKYVREKVASIWREWRYRRIYLRGFLLAPGIDQKDLPESYNTWHGWGVDVDPSEPKHPEAWATLRKHFEEAYFDGNERLAAWFYSWLSDIFTNPMRKPGSAVVLRGLKGTGKSLLADVMKRLVGMRHFARLDKPSQITGQFNGHLQSTILVDVEEAFFSGDKAAEGTLKSWITSDDVQIRLMRTDGFQAKNFSRFVFTSNAGWVVPVTDDERRFFVVDVSDKFRGDKAHFRQLWAEMKHGGGFEEFFKFLLTWQKPKWVELDQPPKTQALARQMEESLGIPDRFFWNAVKTGEDFPCEDGGTFCRREVHPKYVEWCQRNGDKWAATNDKLFAELLERYWLAEKLPNRKTDPRTGRKETVYRVPSLGDVRSTLMEQWDLHDDAFDCDDEGAED